MVAVTMTAFIVRLQSILVSLLQNSLSYQIVNSSRAETALHFYYLPHQACEIVAALNDLLNDRMRRSSSEGSGSGDCKSLFKAERKFCQLHFVPNPSMGPCPQKMCPRKQLQLPEIIPLTMGLFQRSLQLLFRCTLFYFIFVNFLSLPYGIYFFFLYTFETNSQFLLYFMSVEVQEFPWGLSGNESVQ